MRSWPSSDAGALVHNVGADHFYLDVFDEPLHNFFCGVGPTQVRVEIVLFQNLPQGRPAHNLLLDRFDSLIGITGNRRMDKFGWNFLFLDQNGRHGFVRRRPEECCGQTEGQKNPAYRECQRSAAAEYRQVVLEALSRLSLS